MKAKISLLSLALALVFLVGCTKNGRLYNLTTGKVTTIQYSYGGSGRGHITGIIDDERFSGEYVTVANSATSWGSIYANVYSPAGQASGNATRTSYSIQGKQRGEAIVTGDKGTIINCEYVTSAMTGAGSGACQDNHGVKYKLMF